MSNQTETPSIQARRVLVPVANPATAVGLIQLAWKLTDAENGQMLALFVTLSGSEPSDDAFRAITEIVARAKAAGAPIELVTRTAPSIARGILDVALEQGATLMVLGYQTPARGKVSLGPVVESVARTTPCDLVVYRNPSHSPIKLEDIKRVILPLDGSDNSKVAARLGLALASGAGLLFLTNIVSISLAGAAVFAWLGLGHLGEAHTRRQLAASLIVLGLLALPLASTFIDVVRTERETSQARHILEQQFPDGDDPQRELHHAADVVQAEQALDKELSGQITLEITYWRAIIH